MKSFVPTGILDALPAGCGLPAGWLWSSVHEPLALQTARLVVTAIFYNHRVTAGIRTSETRHQHGENVSDSHKTDGRRGD